METAINNRYDFIYLFDVQDGNPNGDPDAEIYPELIRKQVKAWFPMSV